MTTPDQTVSERLRRAPPERAGPIRNFVGAPPRKNVAERAAAVPARTFGSAVETGVRAGQTALKVTNDTARGAVEAGVQTAYMVYEEYVARGRQAALRHQARSADMSQSDYDNNYEDPWAQAWGPMAPMMAPWTQMMRMWTQSMSMWMPGAGEMASQWMSPAMWMGGGAATTPTVTTSVSSKTPTEVTIKLKPSAAGLRLSVERLERAEKTADADPLTDVSLESSARDNRVRLTVAVPEGHPSGSYSGAIRDQFGIEQGRVTVAVRDAGSEG